MPDFMVMDSIVQDEIKRIHSPAVKSEFERMVLQDILDHAQLTGAEYFLAPKRVINDYWKNKLD